MFPFSVGPLKPVRDGESYKYEFTFFAFTGETYSIYPLSDLLLFEPPSLKVVGSDDCENNAASFQGIQGKVSLVLRRNLSDFWTIFYFDFVFRSSQVQFHLLYQM